MKMSMKNPNNQLERALSFYYSENLRFHSVTSLNIEEAQAILSALFEIPINVIIKKINENNIHDKFYPHDIPQFSSLDDCFTSIIKLVHSGLDGVSFQKIGYFLRTIQRKRGADFKYGENHSKCAALMGLCHIDKGVWTNPFSFAFERLDITAQSLLRPKLCLRIPLIQAFYKHNKSQEFLELSLTCLSDSTMIRRKPNVIKLINVVEESLI